MKLRSRLSFTSSCAFASFVALGLAQEPSAKPPEPILDSNADSVRILGEQDGLLLDKEPRVRAQALEVFHLHRHESYVKAIAPLLKDKNDDVAKSAAKALGNQPFPKSIDALLDFATHPKHSVAKPEVAADAVRALGKSGLGKRGYDRLRELFDDADRGIKKAIFQALAEQKEKKAFSLFVDHTDMPAPENPSSPSNPPASYWKAKVEDWNAYKMYVHRGLPEMTGESFTTAKEWKEWAEGPGRKAGFVYRSGA